MVPKDGKDGDLVERFKQALAGADQLCRAYLAGAVAIVERDTRTRRMERPVLRLIPHAQKEG